MIEDYSSKIQEVFDLNGDFALKNVSAEGCGLSQSPCTHFDINVTKNTILGYKIFKVSK